LISKHLLNAKKVKPTLKKIQQVMTSNLVSSQVIDLIAAVFFFLFPEGKVFFEQLNDTFGVTEIIFF
jgi:hypothetical protein